MLCDQRRCSFALYQTTDDIAMLFWNNYLTSNNSTSNTKVALGGITPPAPRAP